MYNYRMGRMEVESRKRSRRADLKRLVLKTVATAGVMAADLVAPHALETMKDIGLLPRKRQKEFIRGARDRLIERGLLEFKEGKLRLTGKGEVALRRLEAREFKMSKPKRWDGKWRVLIFDIPEKKRNLRDRVRETLSAIGFVRLQDSVWLYPYECEELVTLLKADFKIGKDLLYMIVDALEFDAPYRSHFDLPPE